MFARHSSTTALVVAAADAAGCSVLLTEDLHHGRKFGGLTVENPFREAT
jgi:predicted nucleic acid-binding protein